MSFLKDPKILGVEDEHGLNKFSLNLDEEALSMFYDHLEKLYEEYEKS